MLAPCLLALSGCGRYEPTYAESLVLPNVEDLSSGWDRVLVVPVEGAIVEKGGGGSFASAEEGPLERATRDLRMGARDAHVKAVILRVNTPGGGVTASDLLRREVEAFRKTGRPEGQRRAGGVLGHPLTPLPGRAARSGGL